MKYPKLPKAFKRKWVAALRSGKFKQGTCSLWDGVGYCCIGVAGRVCGSKNATMKDVGTFASSACVDGAVAPDSLPEILKGDADGNPVVNTLIDKNDSRDWSFQRIAAWIEKYL